MWAYGVRWSFSVMFPTLVQEFGWPRDITAAAMSFHFLAYGVTAPIAGSMIDRIGARKTMGLGAVLLGLGAATSSLASAPWHYYLSFGLLTGVGLCLAGAVCFTRIVSNWFESRRGMALSLVFAGMNFSFALYPLIALLIERVGVKSTFLIESAVVFGFILPCLVFLVRSHPGEKFRLRDSNRKAPLDARSDGGYSESVTEEVQITADWTVRKAVKTLPFWSLCFTAFASWGVAQQIMITHHVAFAEDIGFSKVYASSILTLFGICMAIGCLVASISDRIGREVTFSIGIVIAISGIAILTLMQDASQTWMLYAYAILFGFGAGVFTPTLAAAATDLFQGKRAGTIIGLIWAAFSAGSTIGPWLGGLIYEVNGSYFIAFILAAALFFVASISMWIAAPRRASLMGTIGGQH